MPKVLIYVENAIYRWITYGTLFCNLHNLSTVFKEPWTLRENIHISLLVIHEKIKLTGDLSELTKWDSSRRHLYKIEGGGGRGSGGSGYIKNIDFCLFNPCSLWLGKAPQSLNDYCLKSLANDQNLKILFFSSFSILYKHNIP